MKSNALKTVSAVFKTGDGGAARSSDARATLQRWRSGATGTNYFDFAARASTIVLHFYHSNAQYKPYVTAQPEIVVVELDGDEDFVVVACDGLWDVVSEDAVAISVYDQLMRNPGELYSIVLPCSI
ncbi:unnamed protein product [Danaus chrysippus]|uniref:(African queen) hypothetical protein n=1 Tax=Danaus chrysippus TaxID=151541 RepID=A0A8J2RJJ5_9NEOP|nr:unnamed protein product [Danaus chrysippus]